MKESKYIRIKSAGKEPHVMDDKRKLPKELIRKTLLQTGGPIKDGANREAESEETAENYAENKVEAAGKKAAHFTTAQGKRLMQKAVGARPNVQAEKLITNQTIPANQMGNTQIPIAELIKSRTVNEKSKNQFQEPNKKKPIPKGKPKVAQRNVKSAERAIKPTKSVQANAKRTMQKSRQLTQTTVKGIQKAGKAIVTSVKSVVAAVKGGTAVFAAGGFLVVVLILIGAAAAALLLTPMGSKPEGGGQALSVEVLSYTAVIQHYAEQYEIPQFVGVLQAIMMQESNGKGSDPMQSSECPYVLRYYQFGSALPGTGIFMWPVPSCTTITSGFGSRWGKNHNGIDLSHLGITGEVIVAAADGTVTRAMDGFGTGYLGCPDGGGYGNHVYLDHGDGITTRYGHCSSVIVKVGDVVTKGQVIGYVGHSGNSSGEHLHFEIRFDGEAVDPMGYFKTE